METELIDKIFKKLDSMEDRIIAIDTALTGDEPRGVLGMKQHVASLKEEFHNHTTSDSNQFQLLNDGQNTIKTTFNKVKYWLAGATAVVSAVMVVVGIAIKFWK